MPLIDIHGKPLPQADPEELKKSIVAKYRETPEGRARLITASFGPAQAMMEAVSNDPTLVENADRLISQMEEFQGFMQGDEEYDKRKFASLLEGLKMLSDEIQGKNIFKKL